MTDDTKTVLFHGVRLSVDDAMAFLTEMEASPDTPCPICLHPNWGLSFSPGEGQFASIPTKSDSGDGTSRYYIGIYSTECLKCGYLRFHNFAPLAKWKKAKESSSDKDQSE